jgi:phospholipase/lecithinase/hemolysin
MPASFSGVFVFGDSLVDPGNDLAVFDFLKRFPFDLPDGAPTADRGYFEGRFTNGYNLADLIANKLVAQASQATFPYGISSALFGTSLPIGGAPSGNDLSFAYGGATAGGGGAPAPSLHQQTSIYLGGFNADPNALYVVNIGANDVLKLVPTGGTPVTGAEAQAALAGVASQIAQEVANLYAHGARHVVVDNVPDVGVTPAYAGAADEAMRRSLLTQDVQTVNALLKQDLAALSVPAGATLTQYDFQAYTDAVTANPAAYHFTNVTQALTAVQGASPDPTGAGFLFFDKLHPTAQAHAQIAAQILAQLGATDSTGPWTPAASIGAQVAGDAPLQGDETFTVTLTAGHAYVFDGLGVSSASGTLADPLVRILDGYGNLVAQADDGGIGLDSHLVFTPAFSGQYTLEVRGVGVTSGTFELQGEDAATSANLLLTGQMTGSNISIQGGPADDTMVALAGANVLNGADGADSIVGGTGSDTINGNKGDDIIVGRSATGDSLLGGQGNDIIDLTGSTGHNIVNGNRGDDTIHGGPAGDTLYGGQGDDLVVGGVGSDWISGDRGDNTLTGGGGADTFHAGFGADVVTDFNPAAGDHVQVDPGVTYAVAQTMAGTVIDLSTGGHMTLSGVQVASLPTGWIFSA